MKTPEIPKINGVKQLTPRQMNNVHLDKRHTVLTPGLLESMRQLQGKP